MLAGRHVLSLLFTDNTLNTAVGVAANFVANFRAKLADCVDDPVLMLEWAVAAFLDVR